MTNLATTTDPAVAGTTDITGPGINGARHLDPARRVGCRHVDLGREEELVTWADWFERSAAALEQFLAHATRDFDDRQREKLDQAARVYRVALTDGRALAVSAVETHTSRGRCLPGDTDRWAEGEIGSQSTCDVITGYTLVGAGPDGRPTALSIPPTSIASVECVLVPKNAQNKALETNNGGEEDDAFGFARFAQMKNRPDFTEIDEPHEPNAAQTNAGDEHQS